MALYTILFGLSIFMIALVLAIIRKIAFHWHAEHTNERKTIRYGTVLRPAVSAMIFAEKCVFRKRTFHADIVIYDIISKSDISLDKKLMEMSEKFPTIDEEEAQEKNNAEVTQAGFGELSVSLSIPK